VYQNEKDFYHGVLAFMATVAIIMLCYWLSGGGAVAMLFGWVAAFFLVTWAQAVYELSQCYSDDEIAKHGGFYAWRENSKTDWGWCFRGFFMAIPVGSLLSILITG
jgi:fatty acid desaturase